MAKGDNGFKEECWVLRGISLGARLWLLSETYASKGNSGGVEFDWESAWDDPRLLGWRHTHPGTDFVTPSGIDSKTMESWVKAAGRPFVCGITCRDRTRYYLYRRCLCGAFEVEKMGWRRFLGLTLAWTRPGSADSLEGRFE